MGGRTRGVRMSGVVQSGGLASIPTSRPGPISVTLATVTTITTFAIVYFMLRYYCNSV